LIQKPKSPAYSRDFEPSSKKPVIGLYTIILTLFLGLGSTAVLFFYSVANDYTRVSSRLQRATDLLIQSVSSPMMLNNPMFEAMFNTMENIRANLPPGREIDQAYLDGYLWETPPFGLETATLEYLPRVSLNQKSELEARFGDQLPAGFHISELQGGKPVPAKPRNEYFPVLYESARDEGKATIGLDRGANPLTRLALDQARDSGYFTTYNFYPMTGEGDQLMISRQFLAVYRSGKVPATVAERRAQLQGFISLVTYLPEEQFLAFLPDAYHGMEGAFFPQEFFEEDMRDPQLTWEMDRGLVLETPYLLPAENNAPWMAVTRATPAAIVAMATTTRWWVLGAGLLITLWISGMLFWSRKQSARVLQLVEDLRHARDRAESASIAKANFLAMMSHEIRTPMNGVIGMTDLLLQSGVDNEQKQMLQTINDCGQSLLTIINDILDFSKIEAGKLDLEYIPVSLTDIVEGSAQAIAHNAARKGLRLLTFIDPALPRFVSGDPVRLRQILINLGSNAIKFTEKGKVVIRADRVAGAGDNVVIVRFSVIDEGIGISEELMRNLFSEFTQAESSTTRKYGGTGLGLSICQRLAEMMDGEIGAHSTPGEGSEFFLTMRFRRDDMASKYSSVCDLGGLRILLIVPDALESEIYRKYLEHWHAVVDTNVAITDCIDACSSASGRGQPYDIVVMSSDWAVEQQREVRRKIGETRQLDGTRFVSMQRGRRSRPRLETESCVSLDVDLMRKADLLAAVSIAAGRASPESEYPPHLIEKNFKNRTVDALSIETARARDALILVAEDNPTNRDVIRRQLNILGYACEMAEDGKSALATWRNNDYALLLTDIQMPNMDGYDLARSIRKDEERTGGRKPIIAVTANAMQGEAEKCLAAGMDDYLSKPVELKSLREKLQRWMPEGGKVAARAKAGGPGSVPGANTAQRGNAAPVDESILKKMFDNEPGIFKEILHDFINPSMQIITEMENGWKERSAKDIRFAAHKLKSAASSIGARKLAELCLSLETAGKEENWKVIDEGMPELSGLMDEIVDYVNRL
jgi:signal transduction histidine kinase/CheY-like chemotaxis protein/HPt (histidine-containing phosphotransfer) domain-containing protein